MSLLAMVRSGVIHGVESSRGERTQRCADRHRRAAYCSVHKPMNFSQNRYPPQLLVPHHTRFTFSRNAQRINRAMTNKCAEIVHTIDIHAIQASELFLATTTIVSAGKHA